MIRAAGLAALLGLFALPGFGQEAVRRFGPESDVAEITLRTTTDIAVFAPVVEAFLAVTPDLAVRYEQWGSNDLFDLSMAECTAGTPVADIVISSGVHQMVKLVNDGCTAPWRSDATAAVESDLRWRDEIWGISREPAVMVYNRMRVPTADVPRTRFDLLDLLRADTNRYNASVATYDIEASGLGFLFAFMDSQEATTFGALMEAFARSGAVATCCSAEIIEGVARGDYLIAYNVLGSYAEAAATENPALGIVVPEDYTLVLSRAALLPGVEANPLAGAFLDFILSPEGQLALGKGRLVGAGLIDPENTDTGSQRLIPINPTLLVVLDQMKADRFIARWRATFR